MGSGNGLGTGYGDPLTDRQREILEDIVRFKVDTGTVPTMRELAKIQGVGLGTIQHHFIALRRKGAIKVAKAIPRGYVVNGLPICEHCKGSGINLILMS